LGRSGLSPTSPVAAIADRGRGGSTEMRLP
jgi:hypothetical protein